MPPDRVEHPSAARLVLLVCLAQTLVQIGAFVWPALLPGMVVRWALSNSEAGWVTAIFYAAYIVAVPIIVPLTDRFDAKRIYLGGVAATVAGHLLFGFLADGFWSALIARALTGIGWAGTYMTGLKLLADTVDAKMLSRAAAGHAASIGVSGGLWLALAEVAAGLAAWGAAFLAAGISAALAWLVVALAVPARPHQAKPSASASPLAMFDFRPVLRNRSAMAYALA